MPLSFSTQLHDLDELEVQLGSTADAVTFEASQHLSFSTQLHDLDELEVELGSIAGAVTFEASQHIKKTFDSYYI